MPVEHVNTVPIPIGAVKVTCGRAVLTGPPAASPPGGTHGSCGMLGPVEMMIGCVPGVVGFWDVFWDVFTMLVRTIGWEGPAAV